MTGVVRTGLPDTTRSGSTGLVARVALSFGGERLSGEVSVDPDELLTGVEVARLLEISPTTWRGYVRRGYAPPADDPGAGPVNRRTPRWKLATVREYRLNRAGQGARTDIHQEPK